METRSLAEIEVISEKKKRKKKKKRTEVREKTKIGGKKGKGGLMEGVRERQH